MDRCRCEEYKKALNKLKFYTVGTYRPDIIENFDRSNLDVAWVKNEISHSDLRFSKPMSRKVLQRGDLPQNAMPPYSYAINQMWCPFMSGVEVHKPLERRKEQKEDDKQIEQKLAVPTCY